jgi:hypothetical protein
MLQLILFICLSVIASAQEWKDFQLTTGCRLFNLKGETIKVFPGDVCLYFDDGKLLTANDDGLNFYDKDFKNLWHVTGHFHHGLALSIDKKKILAMGSDFVQHQKTKKRIDKLMVISLEGKVLHEVLSTSLLKQAKIKILRRQSGFIDVEESHFNSLLEIPAIKVNPKLSFLKEGNFIANSRDDGLFILSSDLQKVEHFQTLSQSVRHQVHDAQILANGNLLIFNNLTKGSTEKFKFSSVQEINLATDEIMFEFTSTPKQDFYSKVSGAVQILDEDHYLISHVFDGTFIYSKSNKKIVNVIRETHLRDSKPFPTHEVRLYDLRKFLALWK